MFSASEKAQLPTKEPPSQQLEEEIQNAEKKLGIETEYDRLMEASLFIDKKFINYALITGVTPNPERIFGAKTWADYLDARITAKEYGDKDLTPDFISQIHKKLTHRSNPDISGKIRSNGVIGASYDESGVPVTYSQEQIDAIEGNPLLKFKRVPADDETSKTGFIAYPHEGAQTQELIEKDLLELCEWFNKTKEDGSVDNHTLAATLQHKLISLHPFRDGNGTLSRLLMNWSLENNSQSPSIIEEPGNDLLTDLNTWAASVKKGSNSYSEFKTKKTALQEAGINNPDALFNLGQDRVFYDYIFKHLHIAPPIPTNGDKHNHQFYQEFLADFIGEMDRFQEYMRSTVSIPTAEGIREVTQGGLISEEIRLLANSSHLPALSPELSGKYFADIEVYRGGMIEGVIDDEKICQMFQDFTGVGAGYRALKISHIPATSTNKISSSAIGESLDYYNQMIAATYLLKKHPDIPKPYSGLKSIDSTIQDHVSGGAAIWDSPFTSTSLDRRVSKSWAMRFGAAYAKGAAHGVLFKAHVPREGIIVTYGGGNKIEGLDSSHASIPFEREILVAGGLQPTSISEIQIMDKDGSIGSPSLKATRAENNGQTTITIEDQREEFVRVRTYTYNTNTQKYEFAGEEQTQIPSTREKDLVSAYLPKVDLTYYTSHIKNSYEQIFKKFKDEKNYEYELNDYSILNDINISKFNEKKITNDFFIISSLELNENIYKFNYQKLEKKIEENDFK